MDSQEKEAHRRFLNAYYGTVKHVYDASRKYYLFGRDRVLRELLQQPWETLVEIGPGTARNLAKLSQARPSARFGGIEASDEMLQVARRRCPIARLEHGFAEDADYSSLVGGPPQRILFSYTLSMVRDGDAALENARRQLAPNGLVYLVDFGDLAGVPLLTRPMKRFLDCFHVVTPDLRLLRKHGAELRWGPGRYYLAASMGPLTTAV